MLQERWVLSGDGRSRTCLKHPEAGAFMRLETCPLCANEPQEMPTGEVEVEHDRESEIAEVEARSFAKWAKSRSERLAKDGTAQDQNTAAKFGDLYIKAMRLWSELREPRLSREHDRYLCEHEKVMRGLRASH